MLHARSSFSSYASTSFADETSVPFLFLQEPPKYKAYFRRWIVLGSFCFLTFFSSLHWFAFAPISRKAMIYFNASSNEINWLSLLFMLVNIFVMIPFIWFINKSPYWSVHFANGCILVGAWMRYAAADNYIIILASSAVLAVATPACLNMPPVLSDLWFPPPERALATSIANLASFAGWALGFLLPSLIVTTADEFPRLMWWYAVGSSATAILVLFCFQSAPPSPPSFTATLSRFAFWDGVRHLFSNYKFIVLVISFGISLGNGNALCTLFDEFAEAYGYSELEIGLIGMLIVFCGIISGSLLAFYLKSPFYYATALKVLFFLGVLSLVGFTMASEQQSSWLLIASSALAGSCLIGFAPITFDAAVEDTFPIPEVASATILNVSQQLGGIAMTELAEWIGVKHGSWVLVGFQIIAVLLTVTFYTRSNLQRTVAENLHNRSSSNPEIRDYVS